MGCPGAELRGRGHRRRARLRANLTHLRADGMSRHMIERTTVRLPSELLDRARRKAAAEDRTLTSLIEDGLRIVTAPEHAGRRQIKPLTVSSARGGPLPGVDLTKTSRLQEIEDFERLEKWRSQE